MGLERSAVPRLSTTVIDKKETPYLTTLHPVGYSRTNGSSSARNMFRLINLESGRSVGAVQVVREPLRDFCMDPQSLGLNALYVSVAAHDYDQRDNGPSIEASGTWDPPTKSWIWQRPPRHSSHVDGNCRRLVFQDGGRTFFYCPIGNAIFATLTPGSSELSLLDQLGDDYLIPVHGAAENREMVIWPERGLKGQGSRLRAWDTAGGGPRTLIPFLPGETKAVGLSPSWFFGATIEPDSGSGIQLVDDASQGAFTLWRSPRAPAGDDPTISVSPIMTKQPLAPSRIRGTDGWMAVQLTWMSDQPDNVPRIFPLLVRTADWKTRWFGARDGKEVLDFTLTNTHFFAIYTDQRFEGATEVFRYDLAKFDSIGLPFEWGE